MIVHEAEPFNVEPPRAALAGRMLTTVDSFYGRNHGPIPVIDPVAWRERVGGMVARPLELSLEELKSGYEPMTLTVTLQCAGYRRAGLMEVRDIPGEDLSSWAAGTSRVSPGYERVPPRLTPTQETRPSG